MTAVYRFAPSPNGELHLGHAYSALFTQARARDAGGRVLLRLEDIDKVRCPGHQARQVIEDLRWIGFHWDGHVRWQSRHLAAYRETLDRLDRLGVLYACTCTRGDIARAASGNKTQDPDGSPVYPGTCRARRLDRRRLADAGMPFALRLDLARAVFLAGPLTFLEHGEGPSGETGLVAADPSRWGDVVLGRRDIGTSYHVAVVTDDAIQGVTCVTRGQDLFSATAIHRVLQALLGLHEPTYWHHGLIRGGDGLKLSKSLASKPLRSFRENGATPGDIRRMIGLAA
jgi:glutamyl-Q tRNA(Asp) synthetase